LSRQYNRTGYNAGGYSGGYSAYSSPYSRFGGGGGFGSYGGGYGGYGSFGAQPFGGGYGQPYGAGMPVGPESLSQRMESGTAATFQLLESIVGAFGGFAQMLESTYMATHSSFFAMIGVAEQFGSLRNYLGQVLSIFALLRWVKRLVNRLLGRPEPLDADAFKSFQATAPSSSSPAAPIAPKPSKKPLIIFFLTVVGLPYLMAKLVRLISAKEEALRSQQQAGLPAPGLGSTEIIDPSSLLFVRATHPFSSAEPQELSFKVDDILAVLTPEQERPQAGWWRGRTRDGRIGWFPAK
jgi:peroxin-13